MKAWSIEVLYDASGGPLQINLVRFEAGEVAEIVTAPLGPFDDLSEALERLYAVARSRWFAPRLVD